ncbi:MAG: hypothetical protein R3253_14595, partial [Longimicrobiales bacterium]|nr:hypothetical protein [Longimicrobiales bacterium]
MLRQSVAATFQPVREVDPAAGGLDRRDGAVGMLVPLQLGSGRACCTLHSVGGGWGREMIDRISKISD